MYRKGLLPYPFVSNDNLLIPKTTSLSTKATRNRLYRKLITVAQRLMRHWTETAYRPAARTQIYSLHRNATSWTLTMRFSTSTLVTALSLWTNHASAEGPPVFFFVSYPVSSTDLRDQVGTLTKHAIAVAYVTDHHDVQLIGRMDNISHWSCANEPGTSKYALLVPRGGDNTTVYSIEQ